MRSSFNVWIWICNATIYSLRTLFGFWWCKSLIAGGLLVILEPEKASQFCKEIEELDGFPAWIIGRVEEGGGRSARFAEDLHVINVPQVDTEGKVW